MQRLELNELMYVEKKRILLVEKSHFKNQSVMTIVETLLFPPACC
jgi:hypothetical protein